MSASAESDLDNCVECVLLDPPPSRSVRSAAWCLARLLMRTRSLQLQPSVLVPVLNQSTASSVRIEGKTSMKTCGVCTCRCEQRVHCCGWQLLKRGKRPQSKLHSTAERAIQMTDIVEALACRVVNMR